VFAALLGYADSPNLTGGPKRASTELGLAHPFFIRGLAAIVTFPCT